MKLDSRGVVRSNGMALARFRVDIDMVLDLVLYRYGIGMVLVSCWYGVKCVGYWYDVDICMVLE